MRYARTLLAALVRSLTGPQAGRASRFALVAGAHLLIVYLLLRLPEIRPPVEARAELLEITFFGESGRSVERTLGTVEPKLERLKVTVPLPPRVRIPDVPPAPATLHTPAVRSESLVVAAPSVPQPGRGAQPAASGPSDHGILVVSRVAPSYPLRAFRNGEHGTVVIALQVDPQGRLRQERVLRSSGSRDLDRAAAAALRRWKFRAAAKAGQSIGAWGRVEVNFYVTCESSPRAGQTPDARNAGCLDRSRAAGVWRFQR